MNKKGFTLVELLAVIVILAVVILIAVTAVIPRMNKAKKKAFLDEALMYLNAGNDAYVTGEETECYDSSNIDEYIKQSKDGYTGTLFVNENGKTLYLTNGTYYLIASDKYIPNEKSIVETKPANFVESCSDTSKSYSITYDLGGGTLGTSNPSSYTSNTPTITLNNPTKSGYRFVGWSSKNLINMEDRDEKVVNNYYNQVPAVPSFVLSPSTYYTLSFDYVIISKTTNIAASVGYGKINTYYERDIKSQTYPNDRNSGKINISFTTPSTFDFDPPYMGFRFVRAGSKADNEVYISNIQFEQGTTATDYQEYMAPTTSAKINRGSTGNKKFIANWEAI